MTSMIERVARAIAAQQYISPWDHLMEHQRGYYIRIARTAIEAMREPTDAMICASLDDWDRRRGKQSISELYRAMIDEALKEQP